MFDQALIGRFRADLDRVISPTARLGIAVSGGPDSLALLLLASTVRRGKVDAASVDHALRQGSRDEAEAVAGLCSELGVSHEILTVHWERKPESALQEQARRERYRLLAGWASERGLDAVATGHHLDDQVETLLMRLVRGAGVRGLAGMRPVAQVPGSKIPLVRPLLGWRRHELAGVCEAAGIRPVEDPSNSDERFERVRMRTAVAQADWIGPAAVAQSAEHLASADEALGWAADLEWDRQVSRSGSEISYRPTAPMEIRRRIVARCIEQLAAEGDGKALRGHELDQIVSSLSAGHTATLRGVLCSGGDEWRFAPAPPRNSR